MRLLDWCTHVEKDGVWGSLIFLLFGSFVTYKCISNLTTHTFDGASVFILLLLFLGIDCIIRGIYGLNYLIRKRSNLKKTTETPKPLLAPLWGGL